MDVRKRIKPGQKGETCPVMGESAGGDGLYAPRKMTFAENVILTIKVLAGFAFLGGALWGISLWVTPQ